jgi:uncharacterized Zn finger protein (UPF0148 family)
MSQAPKTDLARELWETCPECYGNLLADRDGALYCARGHYRAANATSLPPDVDAGQIVNEFEEMLEIEEKRAQDRMEEAGSVGGKGSEKFHNPSKGRARDKAAEMLIADGGGRE